MMADESGRAADGQPVVLYPPGWHIVEDEKSHTHEEMTTAEQDDIRRLFDSAVANGTLIRRPGRQIESPMIRPMFEVDGHKVVIKGFIDVATAERVEDHKTSKDRKYFLSKNKLKDDIQVLLYAAEVLFRAAERGEPTPPKVTVRHNQFLKASSGFTKFTEVDVTVEDIQRNWQRCMAMAQDMYKHHLRAGPDDYNLVVKNLNSCNAYGGCPYIPICSGMETPEVFRRRMERIADAGRPRPTQQTIIVPGEGDNMSGASVFNQAIGQGQGGAPPVAGAGGFQFPSQAPQSAPQQPAAPPPAQQPTFSPQPTAPVAETLPGYPLFTCTPWGVQGCGVGSCGGSGLNSTGTPCGVCKGTQAQANGIVPEMFETGPDGKGNVCWRVLSTFAPSIDERQIPRQGCCRIPNAVTAPATPQAQWNPAVSAPPTQAPKQAPVTPPVQPPAPPAPPQTMAGSCQITPPVAPPVQEPAAIQTGAAEHPGGPGSSKKNGRPKKTFVAYINCFPTCGVASKDIVRGDVIFNNFAAELAAMQGVSSYYGLDTWKRREALAAGAASMAEKIDGHVIFRITKANDDMEHFAKLLIPFATDVVEAMSF